MSIAQRPPGVGTGAPGPSGNFHYMAYASAADGTDFTYPAVVAPGLTYIAIISSATEIVAPALGDFAGQFRKYIGTDGTDGNTVIYGTADPTTEGADGDTYIKLVTGVPSKVFGPKASGVWPAGVDLVGADGTSGNTIIYGTVDPTTEGADGDTYIKLVADAPGVVFGPKAGGVWPAGVSMIGAAGDPGAQGRKAGLRLSFNNGTGTGAPSAGQWKVNSSTLLSPTPMTVLRLSDVDLDSVDLQGLYASWAVGDMLHFKSADNADTTTLSLRITETPSEQTSHWMITVEGVHGAIPSNNEICVIQHAPGPNVLPGVQTATTFTTLPAAADSANETYLVLDTMLHYTSDGTYWRPQNREFLYNKQNVVIKAVVPAATFGSGTPVTAGVDGSMTRINGAGVHGLTAAVAEGRKVCVKTGNGTVVADSLHVVNDVDVATNSIVVETSFAAFGSGAVVLYTVNEDVPLRKVDLHAFTPTTSLEVYSSWGMTESATDKFCKVVLTDGTNEFVAAAPNIGSGSSTVDGVTFFTNINNLDSLSAQGATVVSTNTAGTGTSSTYPALNGAVDTSGATQLIFKSRAAAANNNIDLIFSRIRMSV